MSTVYLITGANRGIGRGLTDLILSRPNTSVVALVRDLDHETSKSLASTTPGASNTLTILPYDAKQPGSAETAISTLRKTHGITHDDVVIANAGTLSKRGPTVDTPAEAILEAVDVNTVGPLQLFRACLPLGPAKFIAISSAIGSTTQIPQHAHSQTVAYGISKAGLNHAMRKLSVEYPDMVIEMLTPGPVMTDLTREYKSFMEEALKKNPTLADRFIPIDKVCNGLLGLIDSASKETSGGFRDWSGQVVPF